MVSNPVWCGEYTNSIVFYNIGQHLECQWAKTLVIFYYLVYLVFDVLHRPLISVYFRKDNHSGTDNFIKLFTKNLWQNLGYLHKHTSSGYQKHGYLADHDNFKFFTLLQHTCISETIDDLLFEASCLKPAHQISRRGAVEIADVRNLGAGLETIVSDLYLWSIWGISSYFNLVDFPWLFLIG